MAVIEYLTEPPTSVPPDRVLVHNVEAGGPEPCASSGGFRAWLAEPGQPNQRPCDCGWAGLGPHFRTRFPGQLDDGSYPKPSE